MKTNAVIRIIIWSLVIVVLLGILSVGVELRSSIFRWDWDDDDSNVETHIPQRIEESSPVSSSDAPLASGDGKNIISVDGSGITKLSIEWVAGSITVSPYEGTDIQISETGDIEKHPMVVKQKDNKLIIQYSEDSQIGFGIHFDFDKDLTILVPQQTFRELDIDAASATVQVKSLSIQEVDMDTASGNCDFLDCDIGSLDIDTASGEIYFTGSLGELDCDAASASFVGVLTNLPSRMEMDSMSGNLDVTLPPDAGFTVTVDGVSTDFSSDFETTSHNGSHIHGNGACRIQVDTMSGDVIIRKTK